MDVSEKHVYSILRVEEYSKKETSVKQVASSKYVPPKRRLTFNGLHGVTSQKIELFISIALRTSYPK
jgi:hypothetical protein